MLILAIICVNIRKTAGKHSFQLGPGYYTFEIVGAQGGSGCIGKTGGMPAKITGQFKLTKDSTIDIVAGSYPDATCDRSYTISKAGNYGAGGNSGHRNYGAGGGYSSISIDEVLIAMAGGGGGSGNRYSGTPAGGIDLKTSKSYRYQYNTNNCQLQQEFLSGQPDHKGQSAREISDTSIFAGAGGGGGYYGGKAGSHYSPAALTPACSQAGQGGSSYVLAENLREAKILDGKKNSHTGAGYAVVNSLIVCDNKCLDCDPRVAEKCYICRPEYVIYNNSCCTSCELTSVPTFEGDSRVCYNCSENCKKCKSSSTCEQCKQGYHLKGEKCIVNPPPVDTHVENNDEKNSTQQEKTVDNGQGLSQIGIDNSKSPINGQIIGSDDSKKDDGFPWWIIAAIVGGVVLVAAIIGIIVCKVMKKDDETVEMEEENVADYDNPTTTTVTLDNPLYAKAAEEDPFKSEFNSEAPKSNVFEQLDIEEVDVKSPDYGDN